MDDEIIDLEEESEEIIDEPSSLEQPTVVSDKKTSNRKKLDHNIDQTGSQVLQKMGVPKPFADKAVKNGGGFASPTKTPNFVKNNARNKIANNPASDRINQTLNKHSNIPKMPLLRNSFKKETNQGVENNISGNQKTETTFQTSFSFLDLLKKKKMIILISLIAIISLAIILLVTMVGGLNTDDDLGKNTNEFITGQMSEEELLAELEYYGYCHNESSCKKQGAYKFFKELKSVYEEYQNKYDVAINTSLILETINYYDNATDNFETYDRSDEELESDNIVSSIWNSLNRAIKKKKKLDENIGDIKTLAEAQTEYVKETCQENGKKQTKTYYQISFNKYISYLKYGTSSSHPNYNGQPVKVENETCEGPQNDYIETDYNENQSEVTTDSTTGNTTVTGSGKGVDIANYALQFVGNRYIYGGSSLTDGTDCSGFTMRVMEHFGISIPHSSKAQANYGTNLGTDINNAAAGDLIVYNGHVAIYLGNNSIVHASSPKSGIKVSTNASYRPIVAIVRLWG